MGRQVTVIIHNKDFHGVRHLGEIEALVIQRAIVPFQNDLDDLLA